MDVIAGLPHQAFFFAIFTSLYTTCVKSDVKWQWKEQPGRVPLPLWSFIFGAQMYRPRVFSRLFHCLNGTVRNLKNFPRVKFPFQFCSWFLMEFRQSILKLQSFNLILNCFIHTFIFSSCSKVPHCTLQLEMVALITACNSLKHLRN